MDASLISFNPERNKLSYVSANNPIWIIRKGELIEIKGEKMPVGKHALDQTPFTGGEMTLEKGDLIYILTDGFQDQFGGEKGKKFKVKPFKNLLLENANLPIDHLQKLIAKQFEDWKGSFEQVDDVCLIGVRI
jgi:serine phosphatase RsbU (regulator of sigma subunit)